jgi:hypothetical protein
MNLANTSSKSAIAEKANALKTRISTSATQPQFVAKVVKTSRVICKPDEFNIWHANADGVKGNGGDLPWGTLGKAKISG